jgi:hypothetical protein
MTSSLHHGMQELVNLTARMVFTDFPDRRGLLELVLNPELGSIMQPEPLPKYELTSEISTELKKLQTKILSKRTREGDIVLSTLIAPLIELIKDNAISEINDVGSWMAGWFNAYLGYITTSDPLWHALHVAYRNELARVTVEGNYPFQATANLATKARTNLHNARMAFCRCRNTSDCSTAELMVGEQGKCIFNPERFLRDHLEGQDELYVMEWLTHFGNRYLTLAISCDPLWAYIRNIPWLRSWMNELFIVQPGNEPGILSYYRVPRKQQPADMLSREEVKRLSHELVSVLDEILPTNELDPDMDMD